MNPLGIIILNFILLSVAGASPTRRVCMEFNRNSIAGRLDQSDDNSEYQEETENDIVDDDELYVDQNFTDIHQYKTQETCANNFEYCFSAWRIEKDGSTKLYSQGCWEHVRGCNQSACIGYQEKQAVVFCCCNTDLCNNNLTNVTPQTSPVVIPPARSNFADNSVLKNPAVWVSFISTAIMLFIIALVFFVSCRVKTKPKPEASPLAPSGPGYSSNLYNVDNLKPISIIGEGKFGIVWKGMVNEQPVAVKIFSAPKKQYFINEREIYSQPFMNSSPSLLTYFGSDERLTSDGKMEYMLVLSLAEYGCLQEYLRANTTTFAVYCRMAISITRGLSFLHTRIQKGDTLKMCICHRDLNSRNILVKSDLSCCLCDFGFAMKTSGSHYAQQGEMIAAETKSIHEVGTLRYMAPEILEGAVNLRDCESSLKQIDVYSLGLVLWELCMRCQEFYPPEMTTPPYKAPYEAEIGIHPSFDQMRLLVLQHKARPLFPTCWGGGSAASASKEICEDLWDHDPDARLSSLCVEERLMEIATLHPRSHFVSSNTHLDANNLISSAAPAISFCPPVQGCHQVIAQVEHTSETFLSSPSSDSGRVIPIKNREMFGQQIQQFQGRNLCLERNLVQIHQADQSNDEKPIKKCPLAMGNQLISGINSDSHFYDMEYEVLVEELLNKNIKTSPTTVSDSNNYSEILPKRNNADKRGMRWNGVRKMIQRKFSKKSHLGNINQQLTSPTNRNIHLNMIESNSAVIEKKPNNIQRPKNLDISPIVVSRKLQTFKTPPHDSENETFTIIKESSKIVTSKSATLNTISDELSSEGKNLKRQRSLEVFREVFGPGKGSVERLRDVHQRIKTPGDVPPSVRKVRASKTLSLYDDRMMNSELRFDGSSNSM
ncbi:CLUMA_CG021245, isoform A [Clunio marinus]|uniref:receptor protein serine/threonine kinase n=1 Tax=Clunio marinus TaxID=568069 RepID=A0A1J1J8J8_9DIPT|nr:CLUMA_CG021245, isoform A [Clunio marinus]